MAKFADWSEGAIGRSVFVTEHSHPMIPKKPLLVCGIYEDFQIGNLTVWISAPVCFSIMNQLTIHRIIFLLNYKYSNREHTKAVYDIKKKACGQDIEVLSYAAEMRMPIPDPEGSATRHDRRDLTVLILPGRTGGIYERRDKRRRREIASAQNNGAEIRDIVLAFYSDNFKNFDTRNDCRLCF
jgi:hypothetical protein